MKQKRKIVQKEYRVYTGRASTRVLKKERRRKIAKVLFYMNLPNGFEGCNVIIGREIRSYWTR